MANRRTSFLSDAFDEALVADAERRVRESGAVLTSKLMPKGLSRAGQASFLEALCRRGLERTGTRIRVPADEQVLDSVTSDGPTALGVLAKRLGGVTGPEAKRSAARLVAAGAAVLVAREAKELLCPTTVSSLSVTELDAIRVAVKKLETMLKWVRPKKGGPPCTLLRDDLEAVLAQMPRSSAASNALPVDQHRAVLEAVARLADPRTQLARVPDVVRALAGVVAPADATRALLSLHGSGRIELRPESGVGLLSTEDAALCPRGIRDTVLSFVRPLADMSGPKGG